MTTNDVLMIRATTTLDLTHLATNVLTLIFQEVLIELLFDELMNSNTIIIIAKKKLIGFGSNFKIKSATEQMPNMMQK